MKRRLLAGIVLCAAALLLGCDNSANAPAVGSLEGTQWNLAAWPASSLNPADFNVTAAFADGQISGRSAVNLYGGPYSAGDDGSFSVGLLTMTLMASDENSMRAESLYHELLAQARRWRIAGAQLILSADSQDLLIFAPQ
jgi:heat shock protein HslJ